MFYISDIAIQLTHTDGEVEHFILESPSGQNPFKINAEEVNIRGVYRDKNNMLRRGLTWYQLNWEYSFSHHDMDLRKLLIAEIIQIAAPPDLAGDYTGYQVRIKNEEVLKSYYGDVPAGAAMYQDFNLIPSSNTTLQFEMVDPVTWDQILQLKWFETSI